MGLFTKPIYWLPMCNVLTPHGNGAWQKAKRKLYPEKTRVDKSSDEAEYFDGSDNGSTSNVEITTVEDVDMDVIDINGACAFRPT